MIAMYEKDVIDIKAAHKKLGGTGVWIDTGQFAKGTCPHYPDGLFHLFSEYSSQFPNEVHDLMIGWIYDNYKNVKSWTRVAMHHKNINFDSWLENMQKVTTEGDDIALYILARIYNKHVFVHNSMYGWSILPYRMDDSYKDVVCKCDLELVFLKCWAFGEVKKIRGPAGAPDAGKKTPKKTKEPKPKPSVIPSNVAIENVIPHNVTVKSDRTLRKRSVAVTKKVTEHKSNRKWQNVDYSKFEADADEPSPPLKRRKPNLMWKPSKTVLAAHKKRKIMSPLPAGKTATTTKGKSVHVPCTDAKASTSTSSAAMAQPSLIGTLTVNASQEKPRQPLLRSCHLVVTSLLQTKT